MNSGEGYNELEIDSRRPLLLEQLTNFVQENSRISFVVQNNYLEWNNNIDDPYKSRQDFHQSFQINVGNNLIRQRTPLDFEYLISLSTLDR